MAFSHAPASLLRFTAGALLSCAGTPIVRAQSAAARAFAPGDWYRVTTLANPAISPDGTRVAFTVTTVAEADNRRHSEVWVVGTTGGDPVRWTAPGTESSNPRWSPDGRTLFFTSFRPGGDGTTWALRVHAPGGEAFQPEQIAPAGSTPSDKSFVVFTSTDSASGSVARGRAGAPPDSGRSSPANAMSRPPFGAITRPLVQARFDGRQIVTFPYKANGVGFLPNPS